MPTVSLQFPFPLNVSAQVGDTVYYTPTSVVQTFNTSPMPNIIEIGVLLQIFPWNGTFSQIDVNWSPIPPLSPLPSSADFIMFSKDNKANLSSELGYYAEVEMKNASPDKAELFAVGVDVFESSK